VNHVKATAEIVSITAAEILRAQMNLAIVRLRTEGSNLHDRRATRKLQPARRPMRQRGPGKRRAARPRGRARCRTRRQPAPSSADPHLDTRPDGSPRTTLRQGFERALAAAEHWRATALDYQDLLDSALKDLEQACTDLAELRRRHEPSTGGTP
jgi:hypothetical protein